MYKGSTNGNECIEQADKENPQTSSFHYWCIKLIYYSFNIFPQF